MRRISCLILLFAAALLGVSCVEEIRIHVDGDHPVLVMNAQLHSDDTLHTVILSTSFLSDTESFGRAAVTVTVNGGEPFPAFEEEEEEYHQYSSYRFRADFQAGDRVRIDARRGEMHAFSEVVFPAEGKLRSVEMTEERRVSAYGTEQTLYVFRPTVSDPSGVDDYYRFALAREVEWRSAGGEAPTLRRESTTSSAMLDASEDPVLSEGHAGADAETDLFSSFLPGNAFCAFTDRLFSGSDCTFRLLSDSMHFRAYSMDSSTQEVAIDAVLKLYTLSADQYRYLRALDNFNMYGYELNFLTEPTSLPCNVRGGIGFVSAETCVSRRLRIREGKPDEAIFY